MANSDAATPTGRPIIEASKTAAATAVSAVPVVGPFLSGLVLGAIQADTIRKLNFALNHIEALLQQHALTVEALVSDPIFRQGVAECYASILRQEADSKRLRIPAFIGNHLSAPATGAAILEDAVLKALVQLPASHIEEFVTLLDTTHNFEDLRDSMGALGRLVLDPHDIIRREFSSLEGQDYCGSPANRRFECLVVLFESLQSAGLVRATGTHGEGTRQSSEFEVADLARSFVLYCLPPRSTAPVAPA